MMYIYEHLYACSQPTHAMKATVIGYSLSDQMVKIHSNIVSSTYILYIFQSTKYNLFILFTQAIVRMLSIQSIIILSVNRALMSIQSSWSGHRVSKLSRPRTLSQWWKWVHMWEEGGSPAEPSSAITLQGKDSWDLAVMEETCDWGIHTHWGQFGKCRCRVWW